MNHLTRPSLTLLPLIGLLALTGCIVGGVSPMVKRQRGISGQQLVENSFDPLSVKIGVTTRNEALDKLSVINTGLDTPHFFWGRWATSTWGYMFALGGPTAAAADNGRIWGIRNLLVTFDENGVAQKMQLIDDGLPLWREIIKQSKSMRPIELSTPISLQPDSDGNFFVTFSPKLVAVERRFGTVKWTFAPDKIRRLSHTGPNDKRNHPGSSCHVLHLREQTPVGKKIMFCADAPDLFATFRYLHRYAPADMEWE